ncbi:MAG: PQQ-dependent sugar dehydrogenase [Kineosporiaceae bacterium]
MARRSARAAAVALAVTGSCLLSSCSDDPAPGAADTVAPSPPSPSPSAPTSNAPATATTTRPSRGVPPAVGQVTTVASGLAVPWGLAFLPDGSALVAERDSGRILRLSGGSRQVVATPPGVAHGGEGGLLGLAVLARGASTQVFAYLTSVDGDNRVVTMDWDGQRLAPPRVVLKGIPSAGNHNGGRLAVGPDGMVYVATGDAGLRSASQDRGSLAGKILRMTPGGGIPSDNPFPGSLVWSWGHRNVQGLAFDSAGRLWATEFGQNTWDELNLIRRGGNYGWPLVEGDDDDPRYVRPQASWRTSEASPSGVAIVDDVAYVAALRGRRVWQVPVAGGSAGRPVPLFVERYGRLRAAAVAPDGSLWLTTSNRDGRGRAAEGDDRILRVALG